MQDSSDNTLDEALSLSEIVVSEGSWSDTMNAVCLVDALRVTLSLGWVKTLAYFSGLDPLLILDNVEI